MWVGQDAMAYFHGPWFVVPREIPPQSSDVRFYKQEAFLSTISDSNPLLSVVGRMKGCVCNSSLIGVFGFSRSGVPTMLTGCSAIST